MSEYSSGADYDAQYDALYEPEIRVLSALALRQGGAVLDFCCGTGIVTIPLATTGLEVVGVDISPAMLEHAKAKAEGRKNPTFYLQDVLEFNTAQQFGLALMTGNAFQAFLSEAHIKALLATVYEHLEPGGVFVFDTRLPEGYDFTLDDDFRLWNEYKDVSGNSVRWLVKQAAFDAERGVLHFEMKDVYADGTERRSSEDLKFTPLETLLALARAAGFEVVGHYQNWHLEPLRAGAAAMVLELKKPAS